MSAGSQTVMPPSSGNVPHLSDPLSIHFNGHLAYSAKNLAKSGDFLSRKRKVMVHGKFHHQSGGYMLLTPPRRKSP
jgi:hypothetical protein